MITEKAFNYKGSNINFISNGQVMVNATEMASHFNEKPNNWHIQTYWTEKGRNFIHGMVKGSYVYSHS